MDTPTINESVRLETLLHSQARAPISRTNLFVTHGRDLQKYNSCLEFSTDPFQFSASLLQDKLC